MLTHISLVERVYQEIFRRLVDGVIKPGERLVIDRLAAEFGTSAIPVREALARLLATRLLTFETNRGYRVAPAPTAETIRQTFEARLVLETGAVALIASRVSPLVIKQLQAINARIKKGRYGPTFEGLRAFIDLNEAFHVQLVALAGNPLIADAYRQLGYHQQTFRYNHGRGVPDLTLIVNEHDTIIQLLRDGDGEVASRALARHIRAGYERLTSTGAAPANASARQNRASASGD